MASVDDAIPPREGAAESQSRASLDSVRTSLSEARVPSSLGTSNGDLKAPRTSDLDDGPAYQISDAPHSAREAELAEKLARIHAEKETLEGQYRGLLAKLTTMRSTLGDKLRQDADELDRRADQIAALQATNDDLTFTAETLRAELVTSNEDAEAAHKELDLLRSRAFDSQKQTSDEAAARELALREAQEDLERVRDERERWEADAGRERVAREDVTAQLSLRDREVEVLAAEVDALKVSRDDEAQSAANLQNVLEEFQAAKDRELKETLGDLQEQLQSTSRSLADFKQRATAAETRLAEMQTDSERTLALQQEVKEKSLLIGKLRHEAVILNEHLTEALRRLKKDTSEHSVDRRLVTNVLISFFNTPRADTKRFEMLSLLASILSWSDDDRERAGLQRSSGGGGLGLSTSSAPTPAGHRARGHSRTPAGQRGDDVLGDNESFSNLWIEFLLREASQPNTPAASLVSPSGRAEESGLDRYPLPNMTPLSPISPSPNRRKPSLGSESVVSTAASSIVPATKNGR